MQNYGIWIRELQSGKPTITGIPKYLNGIEFEDGTTQTTAFSDSVNTSTATTWNTDSSGAGFTGQCPPQISTLTMTTDAVPVDLIFKGACRVSSTNMGINVLIDSEYEDGYTLAAPMLFFYNSSSADAACSFHYRTASSMSAGSHTFCLQLNNSGANSNLRCSQSPCYFEVREVR